jgi:hypothetical protein
LNVKLSPVWESLSRSRISFPFGVSSGSRKICVRTVLSGSNSVQATSNLGTTRSVRSKVKLSRGELKKNCVRWLMVTCPGA